MNGPSGHRWVVDIDIGPPPSSSHHHPQTNVTKRIMWVDDIDIGPAQSLLAPNSNIVSSDGVNLCHNHHHHNHHHHHHHCRRCHHHQPSFPVRIILASESWPKMLKYGLFLVSKNSSVRGRHLQCWRNITLHLISLEQSVHLIEKMHFLSLSLLKMQSFGKSLESFDEYLAKFQQTDAFD